MVVRREVLLERLAGLRETLRRLEVMRGRSSDDPAWEWAIERGLQIAAQAVFDIGNHILSGAFGERPTDYASVPVSLAGHGVITDALQAKLRGLAGFRNLLVHDYARVDAARVRQALDRRAGDLAEFADAIEAWLDRAAE
ncbi:MAG: DUF86 domain-containing protein [Polyangia bacterium]